MRWIAVMVVAVVVPAGLALLDRPAAVAPMSVVCDANDQGAAVVEAGQYGTVVEQVCRVGTFDGAPVLVRFVD